jgi:hypothetical protein
MFQDISKRSDGAKIVLSRYLSRLVHKNENISEVFVLVSNISGRTPKISSFKYIQRHPGLIGEKTVYAFIKVQNRAGLDRKVWFGPILADETAPICPPTIQTLIENENLVIKWTSS